MCFLAIYERKRVCGIVMTEKLEFVGGVSMIKAILVSLVTFIISLFVEVNIGVMWNMPGVGIIFAVVIMGGIILYSVDKRK